MTTRSYDTTIISDDDSSMCAIDVPFDPKEVFGKVRAPVKVTLSGLRRRPEGEGYQVWVVRDDAWVSVGICNTNENGWWQGDFDFALDDEDLLAVTVEPSGGSTRPSGEVGAHVDWRTLAYALIGSQMFRVSFMGEPPDREANRRLVELIVANVSPKPSAN